MLGLKLNHVSKRGLSGGSSKPSFHLWHEWLLWPSGDNGLWFLTHTLVSVYLCLQKGRLVVITRSSCPIKLVINSGSLGGFMLFESRLTCGFRHLLGDGKFYDIRVSHNQGYHLVCTWGQKWKFIYGPKNNWTWKSIDYSVWNQNIAELSLIFIEL